jgi:prepilin-type N-terminal cleavage/methylation domain-containing protein
MNGSQRGRGGFTLVEIIVTMLILGVLSAIALPQYFQSIEYNGARQAVATTNMIGRANRLFALDHLGAYNNGGFGASPCGAGACNATAPFTNACNLVYCRYIADQTWASLPWTYLACDPATASGNCTAGSLSAAQRSSGPNTNWIYNMTTDGVIHATNAPPPSY